MSGPRLDPSLSQQVLDAAPVGLWLVAPGGRTLYVNDHLARLVGLPAAELVEHMPLERLDPADRDLLVDRLRSRESHGQETYDVRYAHPDGRPRVLRAVATPLVGADGRFLGSLGVVSDVTDDRAREEAVRRLVFRDELTGLASRRILLDRLDQVSASVNLAANLAVLFVDLDHFSLINDARGLEAGDAALATVGRRLGRLADSGAWVGRLGSDEFLLLLEDADLAEATATARELLAELSRPIEVPTASGPAVVHVSGSVGIAVGPCAKAWELTRRARAALHHAKRRGGGQAVPFDPSRAGALHERLTIAGDLRAALRRGDLTVAYQPLVDLASGRVLGLEALARWTHPRLGEVPPALFVAVAAEHGITPELDAWVLRTACSDFARLRASGVLADGTELGVNTGAARLEAPQTVESTLAAVREAGLAPSDVCVEVTETEAMGDPGATAQVLRTLREAGVRVAIDDFGTGHSNLAYLRRFPADYVKIDRSFVERISDDADDLAVVASIVDLARVAGMRTVAEGVETTDQLALLRRMGCFAAQGFLWTPALAPQPLAELLTSLPGGRFTRPPGGERDLAFDRWDSEVAPAVLERVMELHRAGASVTTIAAALNGEGLRTATGRRWHRSSVARVIAREAYRGGPSRGGPGPQG